MGAFELGLIVGVTPVPDTDLAVVFPNPMRDGATLRISPEISGPVEVILLDLQGKTWLQKAGIMEKEVALPRGQLPAGMYFIRLRHAQGETVLPLMIW
jgi:hypothetical protein